MREVELEETLPVIKITKVRKRNLKPPRGSRTLHTRGNVLNVKNLTYTQWKDEFWLRVTEHVECSRTGRQEIHTHFQTSSLPVRQIVNHRQASEHSTLRSNELLWRTRSGEERDKLASSHTTSNTHPKLHPLLSLSNMQPSLCHCLIVYRITNRDDKEHSRKSSQ